MRENQEELFISADFVIQKYAQDHRSSFDLFYKDNQFFCQQTCLAELMPFFIRHISVNQSKKGLSSSQWLKLGRKVAELQKEVPE